MQHSKQQIKSGFIWSALDSFGSKALGLVISLVLANLLGPSVYGLIAMLTIFIAIAQVFVNSGFSSALIRKVNRSEKDYATTFYFSVVVASFCYLILFLSAPSISRFYGESDLISLVRIISLTIIIETFAIIPRTKLSVTLDFKKQAKANLIALLFSGAVGLTLAFNGYGVWALVFQQITNATVSVIMFNLLSPWKPVEKFCKKAFVELFDFGSKLLASSLLDTVYNNIYGLIIGKTFSAGQLGIFNQAKTLSHMPAMTITGVIQKVTYPMFSTMQNDATRLDEAYLRTLRIAMMVVGPVMFGLCITSAQLINLLLGEKWQDSAPLISILSMAFVLYPIHAINLNILQVKGRSDYFLKIEIIKKINITIMLFLTVPLGVKAMCVGMVVTSYIAVVLNTYYTAKLSSISQYKQMLALLPILIITMVSASIGYLVGLEVSTNWLSILVILSTALLCYLILLLLFQKSLIIEMKSLLKGA
ncbi:lipopolysaccharide biosynthesis protein [Vibrio breoganii]